MKITYDNVPGRVLLALRAGRMEPAQIAEAFPSSSSTLNVLARKGYLEKVNGFWQITSAGRDICPNRRDAHRRTNA